MDHFLFGILKGGANLTLNIIGALLLFFAFALLLQWVYPPLVDGLILLTTFALLVVMVRVFR
jgi:hypothetical protein